MSHEWFILYWAINLQVVNNLSVIAVFVECVWTKISWYKFTYWIWRATVALDWNWMDFYRCHSHWSRRHTRSRLIWNEHYLSGTNKTGTVRYILHSVNSCQIFYQTRLFNATINGFTQFWMEIKTNCSSYHTDSK